MSEKETNSAEVKNPNDQKMDAIKQLIFGENMVEYDQRFQEVIDRLNDTQQLLESKIESLDNTVNATIEKLNIAFENKNAKLEEKFTKAVDKLEDKKTDRRALGKMLQNIGEKLQA